MAFCSPQCPLILETPAYLHCKLQLTLDLLLQKNLNFSPSQKNPLQQSLPCVLLLVNTTTITTFWLFHSFSLIVEQGNKINSVLFSPLGVLIETSSTGWFSTARQLAAGLLVNPEIANVPPLRSTINCTACFIFFLSDIDKNKIKTFWFLSQFWIYW